jgi:hypothetical protein
MPTSRHWEMREASCLRYSWHTNFEVFKTEDHIFGLETHLQHYAMPLSTVVNHGLNIHDKWNSSLMTFQICSFRYQEHIKVTICDWRYRRNGFLLDESGQAGWLSVHTSDMYSGGACLKFCLKHTFHDISKFSSILLIKYGNSMSN